MRQVERQRQDTDGERQSGRDRGREKRKSPGEHREMDKMKEEGGE
jgi:hypothetical protein